MLHACHMVEPGSTEYKFDTTGGYKNSRYADVVVYDSKGRVTEVHQVGKLRKSTGRLFQEKGKLFMIFVQQKVIMVRQ